jgi:hypothetical protein
MKVHIVYPRFERFLEAYPLLGELPPVVGMWKYKMPPALGPQILATMCPPDVEWKIVDENLGDVDDDDECDLAAISFFTPQASNAYALGDRYRARGIPVVMGGMHPSMIPEDVVSHCDAVCIGEAEGTWLQILSDARAGALKPRYSGVLPPASAWVKPKQDLFAIERDYDWHASLVQVARGCPPFPTATSPYLRDERAPARHRRRRRRGRRARGPRVLPDRRRGDADLQAHRPVLGRSLPPPRRGGPEQDV